MTKPLTPRQARFVQEYLVDLNGTQAVIRAGYSERGAEVQAHRLLRNPKIAELVQQGRAERAARVEITQDEVLIGLRREAMLTGEGASHSARVQAWGLLGKHLALFPDRQQMQNLDRNGNPVDPPMPAIAITITRDA